MDRQRRHCGRTGPDHPRVATSTPIGALLPIFQPALVSELCAEALRLGICTEYVQQLIRQYRLAVRHLLWELPAGSIDTGETALQTARRELVEETGYQAKSFRKLGSVT